MSVGRAALVVALACGLGFGLGLGVGSKGGAAPAVEPAVGAALSSLEARVVELQRGNSALRAQLSVTGAACLNQPPTPQVGATPNPPSPTTETEDEDEPEVDVAVEEAVDEGRALLTSLEARGQWTDAERRDWKFAVNRAGKERGTELLVALSSAINAGQVRPQR